METIKFRWPNSFYSEELTLGEELKIYMYHGKSMENCRFIKVTRKGFNILNLDTNRTVLNKHLYAKSMVGKEYPRRGVITKEFTIPNYVRITKKRNRKVS